MSRRAALALVAALLTGGALGGPARAQDGVEARIEELRARARRIEEVRGADASQDALQHARRAIVGAREAHQRRDGATAERLLAIADAALVLADRAAARRRAHLALEEAREREQAARRRAQAARDALEASLQARARGAEDGS